MTDNPTIPLKEALTLIAEGEYVHTFRNTAGILVGCDWERSHLIRAMSETEVKFSGEPATQLNHGINIINNGSYLFIATRPK